MVVIGYILAILGFIVGLAGNVMFLNVVYRRNVAWFFASLFIPLVAEIFLLTHWRATWKPYSAGLFGFAVACLGAVMSGLG